MTERIPASAYHAHMKPNKTGRIKGTRRTKIGDMTFDSELEARWWALLAAMDRAGKITDLRRQVNIPLMGRDGPILTPTGRRMHYVADFVWIEDGKRQVADAKGHRTETYLIKRAILAAMGITIRELR